MLACVCKCPGRFLVCVLVSCFVLPVFVNLHRSICGLLSAEVAHSWHAFLIFGSLSSLPPQAAIEGRWILIEDINLASFDVLSMLVPVLESGVLRLPGADQVCA